MIRVDTMDWRQYVFLSRRDYDFLMKMNPDVFNGVQMHWLSTGVNIERTPRVVEFISTYLVI